MQPSFDIPGVGRFVHEVGTTGDERYVCEHPRVDGGIVRVIVYPDHGPIDAAYCDRVRRTTLHVEGAIVDLLNPVQTELEKMIDSYEIVPPSTYDELFRGLRLEYVKFLANDTVEIIFAEGPATGWFSLVAMLDPQLKVRDVWFDG